MTFVRSRVTDWIPPGLARMMTGQARHETRFVDEYESWSAAAEAATGYDEGAILRRVLDASRAVIHGDAQIERDGVAMARREYRWPVVAALLEAAIQADGRLSVMDFGGSLGSTLRQVDPLLGRLAVKWGVVEQPAFVAAGREFENERLNFFETIEACVDAITPTVALFSSVLQYLPDPHSVLRRMSEGPFTTLVIDRTPMTYLPDDLPVVQVVPPALYRASYPAWLLSRSRLDESLHGWNLVDEFPSIEPDARSSHGVSIHWLGRFLKRPTH